MLWLPVTLSEGQRSPAVEVTLASYSCRIVNLSHFCNMSRTITVCRDFPPEILLARVTGLWHDPSPLQYFLTELVLCKPICMGNVKWQACVAALLWNVSETDWIMLICVKHGDQLVEVISIMWIQFKWETSFAGNCLRNSLGGTRDEGLNTMQQQSQ